MTAHDSARRGPLVEVLGRITTWQRGGARAAAAWSALALALLGLCACETTIADSAKPVWPRTADVAINQGLNLSTGEVIANASYLKADLIVYKNKSGFDIKPGGTSPSEMAAMGVFKQGGVPTVFPDLAAVPSTKALANTTSYMSNVGQGHGAVIQHNLGTGWSKIWIQQAISASGVVRIRWQPLP